MQQSLAPEGADVLLEFFAADMQALIEMQRNRLSVKEMTAISNRHLGDDLEG